tara:strand:- start:7358 stop:8143 length:786 start_codon:yes stop_codon:yes gene_type:complete
MTKALILAAGQGKRLRPLTNDKPKCLVSLLGKSLLEQQINTLRKCGIKDIQIVTGYLKEQIENLGISTSFNSRFETSNMVVSLFSSQPFLEKDNDDLIIAYGDIVYERKNLESLLACNDEMALMIDKEWRKLWSSRFENPLDDAETLLMDQNNFVMELGKKTDTFEKIHGQYTGLIKIRGDKIDNFIKFYKSLNQSASYDGRDFNNMYMTSLIQLLINYKWKVKAVLVSNGWLEVDSIEDLSVYESMAKEGTLENFYKVEK